MKKRVLIIDSHKGFLHDGVKNLHVRNAKEISNYIGATLIASHDGADAIAQREWDVIVFNHASAYSTVDYECLKMNPQARLIYITNEYNLGEPQMIWMAAKEGRKYEVIANHPAKASKVVQKYVEQWHTVNLNTLIFNPATPKQDDSFFDMEKNGAIYYGAYRAGREKYFRKYFDSRLTVSTSLKNRQKFSAISMQPRYIEKMIWKEPYTLSRFSASLYIEDEKTHVHYNHLANRFYEAISLGVPLLFDESCRGTVEQSGYEVPNQYFIDSADELHKKAKSGLTYLQRWVEMAKEEKKDTLNAIKEIINR